MSSRTYRGPVLEKRRRNNGRNMYALCEAVSMEWVDAPPAGAEAWTDDQWEQAIEREARRRLGREIVARMDAQRAKATKRWAEKNRQQKGATV